ncbi:hypothetical protein AB0H49_22675 [Nocardia sp. NPDC050713]|uniref:hypothetical protein n=1 Tax=Nocardia sp. NPDC050713 TaxID=3154511 RepID=UPI0033E6EDE6
MTAMTTPLTDKRLNQFAETVSISALRERAAEFEIPTESVYAVESWEFYRPDLGQGVREPS